MIQAAAAKLKIRLLVTVLCVIALMVLFHSCMTFRMSKKEVDEFFRSKNITGSQHQYKSGKYTMHYAQSGDETKPLVLFVHGSPGSLSAFIDFLGDTSLITNALLVTTDRPGFGYSNFGLAETSLEKQAAALKPILEKYNDRRPIILVGHSLGGPVIAQLAMDYPDLVDGLIFVAASIDPELEPNELWFRAPLATPFLSWVLPRSFRASNEEIYQLKPQLENMLPRWKEITCPVIVIQGKKDHLVPAGNADFAKKMLVNAPVEFMFKEDMDHFVPWSNPELIRQAILDMLSRNRPASVIVNH
jgi:pimeloyl-ACP methyl ester carboxylesterase